MQTSTRQSPISAPLATALLPISFLAHLAEEWFAGFLSWTPATLGYEIGVERFVIINATAFVVFAVGAFAALRYDRMAWFAVSLATLLGLNGALHILATIGFGRYSPGAITGLVIYLPLSIAVLRSATGSIAAGVFTRAVVLGVVMHGLVAVLAFM